MKNLLLLFAALLCIYLYVHPRVETRIETIPVVAVAPPPTPRPVPAPAPEPKLYYHSALDAPAMDSGAVANGYFSTDPAAATGQHLTNPVYGSVSGYNPYYYGSYGGGIVNNYVTFNNGVPSSATRVYPTPLPSAYVGRPRLVAPVSATRGTSDLQRVHRQDY